MKIAFATQIKNGIIELDQTEVLRLMGDHQGIAVFPQSGKTVISPLLRLRDWDRRWMPAHWTPTHGLGVGAFVNSGGADLQMMGMQAANSSEFENRFEEALANPQWVATHAESARREMLSKVEFAALCMELAWEKALNIPPTHHVRRWRATSVFRLSRDT